MDDKPVMVHVDGTKTKDNYVAVVLNPDGYNRFVTKKDLDKSVADLKQYIDESITKALSCECSKGKF